MPNSADNVKAVDLERGLYLIRYNSADDSADAPLVTISTQTPEAIDILHDPNEEAPELWQPGGCLVVRARAKGHLAIAISPALQSRSTRAVINIEPIRSGGLNEAEPAPSPVARPASRPASLDISSFRLMGHVSRVGDVYVGPDQWIAGPEAPSRIEGFAIEWPDKPAGLDLRYAVALARPDEASRRPRQLNEFAGTRGKSMPILGVQLELVGAEAHHCQLVAEALYLGAPMLRTAGPRLELKGPTGREPLVGLRVGIQPRGMVQQAAPVMRAAPAQMRSAVSAQDERNSGRVRVFRRRP